MKTVLAEHVGTLYQTHTWADQELNIGIRGTERRKFIRISDIREKRVLDLGCATGAESIWAYEKGAKNVLGIDSNEENIRTFNRLVDVMDISKKVSAQKVDLRNIKFAPEWDTLFCFSITQHVGYQPIWKAIPEIQIVYLEGGADSRYKLENLSDEEFHAEFLGYAPANRQNLCLVRPVFRLVRRVT